MDPRGVRLLGHRLHASLADLVGRLPSAGRDDAVRLPRLVWIRARGLRAAACAWPLRDILPLPVHDAGQAPLHGSRRSRRLVLQVRRHPHQDAAPLQRPHLRLRVQLQGAAPLWSRGRARAGGGRRRRQPRQGGARRGVVDEPAARRRKDLWLGEQAARAAAAAAISSSSSRAAKSPPRSRATAWATDKGKAASASPPEGSIASSTSARVAGSLSGLASSRASNVQASSPPLSPPPPLPPPPALPPLLPTPPPSLSAFSATLTPHTNSRAADSPAPVSGWRACDTSCISVSDGSATCGSSVVSRA
mmetsp:Transcript_3143/g.10305  ORF Transcript_3143/g.10305 Transcript_3143/m.10305 type:complete len:305 (+) Transcript_3143:286-1200(+)